MRYRPFALLLALTLIASACGDDDTATTGISPVVTTGAEPVATTTNAGTDPGDPLKMWVTDYSAGLVAAVDLTTLACNVTDVGVSADLIAFGLGGLWITDPEAFQLVLADPATGEVLGRRNVDGRPSDLALSDTSVWLTIPETSRALEIDPASGAILSEIPTDPGPSSIALGSRAVGTWDALLSYEDGDGWTRDMGGSIYDAQFFGGNLWVLVVFFDQDHNPLRSEIWVIDPQTEEAVLFDAVPDYLNGIRVDSERVVANSLKQGEVAIWWGTPAFEPAETDPYWADPDFPTKPRPGGDDVFLAHHSPYVTQIDFDEIYGAWGLQRSQGTPPPLWDQPGTTGHNLEELCDAHGFGSTDVAAASALQLEVELGMTPDPWSTSDPESTGAAHSSAGAFFSSCRTNSSSDGTIGAAGTLTGGEAGAIILFRIVAPDATSYPMGDIPVDADGNFEFPPVTPPVSPPFTVELSSGAAMCQTPIE